MTQRIRVLGQVATRTADGDEVTLRRRREREVLAMLVAAGSRSVTAERLLTEVWGDDGSGAAVQVAVSRLRAMLDPSRSGPREVESTPAGYRLVVDRDAVDAWSFEDLAERALSAPTPADRLVLGTRAEGLWAGEPYAECQASALRAEATRLVELHVTIQEARAEALLALGHPAAAVRLLAPVAPDHPYREQLWALLAKAQFACARQADALSTLAALRTRLAEDLGVDPSSVVRAMEHAVLTQDPGLSAPARSVTAHRGRVAIKRRCRAMRVGYVVGHTPVAALGVTGTMTG